MINLYLTYFFLDFQDNSLIKLSILSTQIEGIPNEGDFIILKKYDRLGEKNNEHTRTLGNKGIQYIF